MKKLAIGLVLLLVCCAGASAFDYYRAATSVVVVFCKENQRGGGGVVLSRVTVVTMAHVVETCKSVTVTFRDGFTTQANVVSVDKANDLATLRPDSTPELLSTATIDTSLPKVGDTLHLIGHPNGLFWSYSRGYMAYPDERSLVIGNEKLNVIEVHVSMYGGSSGGGLFNDDGRLIAVADARLEGTDVGYFIPASTVCKKLLKCKPHKEG